MAQPCRDPLGLLPAELVLRILDFAPLSVLAALSRTSRAWHRFLDIHQETIYRSPTKTTHPPDARDFAFLSAVPSFSKYYDGVRSWKDLCKRQTLLALNWRQDRPTTRESILQVPDHSVWRFRPDYRRRIFISTAQEGGVHVHDMDTGKLLWKLGRSQVRRYAHLEYQDGLAVWDRWGNALG